MCDDTVRSGGIRPASWERKYPAAFACGSRSPAQTSKQVTNFNYCSKFTSQNPCRKYLALPSRSTSQNHESHLSLFLVRAFSCPCWELRYTTLFLAMEKKMQKYQNKRCACSLDNFDSLELSDSCSDVKMLTRASVCSEAVDVHALRLPFRTVIGTRRSGWGHRTKTTTHHEAHTDVAAVVGGAARFIIRTT